MSDTDLIDTDEPMVDADPFMLEGVTDYALVVFLIRAASYGHSIPRRAGLNVGRILRNAKYLSCLLSREHWPGMEVESADLRQG